MLTRLCLIRHGETDWNAERRLQGHIDIPLNGLGHRQAQATAERLHTDLRAGTFDALYCSDLRRAYQTAVIIAQRLGLQARTDHNLRERHYGDLQGLTLAEATSRYPDIRPGSREQRDPDIVPPNGQSLRSFAQNVETGLQNIVAKHSGQCVLVVSHGGVLDVVYRMATSMPLDTKRDFNIGNATLNWIGFESGHWRLIAWDQRSHLANSRDELPL